MTQDNLKLNGFEQKLVSAGVLTAQVAKEALQAAIDAKKSYVQYLLEKTLVSSHEMAKLLSSYYGVPLFDLAALDEELMPKEVVFERLIEKHQALPLFKRGDRLFIGISDPNNMAAVYEIKFHTGLSVSSVLVESDKLARLIEKFISTHDDIALGDLSDNSLDFADISTEQDDEEEAIKSDVDDAPIVRFINKILLDGIKRHASDIHFEPYEKRYRVRFRIDGILYEAATPPVSLASRIAARLKVMSRLDISERRLPQDGHFKLRLSKKNTIDFRVSSCPTIGGEKIVLRILDPTSAKIGIEKLGYEDFQQRYFLEAIERPQGMVLVTGPTGSGKTVSLYTALNILNTTERNISTVEDPVEINLEGINQVNINTRAGLNFATALRSFLRQDPDVIMVGEIRDLETAEIAIKAAQTGHMVLSTLHTNSTPETLSRLINMGVPAFNLATAIHLIIAQRLARRLCDDCKTIMPINENALKECGFTDVQIKENKGIYKAQGCSNCTNGYRGRVGIYEVLPMTDSIGRIIMNGGNAIDIADQALKEGLQTLRMSAIKKVLEGLTSLEEINRVTKD